MIPQDKILHFIAGFISAIGCLIIHPCPFAAAIAVISVAAGKEMYDKLVRKTFFDSWDMWFTIFGGSIPIIIYAIKTGAALCSDGLI